MLIQYHATCFDAEGQVWMADLIEAETDEEAILLAATIPKAVKVELRDGERVVTAWISHSTGES